MRDDGGLDDDCLFLNILEDSFLINSPTSAKSLRISRPEGSLSIIAADAATDDEPKSNGNIRIYGVLGMIRLLSGPFVLVITGRRKSVVGGDARFLGKHSICRIQSVQILPCSTEPIEDILSPTQMAEEAEYLRLLELYIDWAGLYYSKSYDLTERLQSQHDRSAGRLLLEQADQAFLANRAVLEAFGGIEEFIVLAIEGFVEFKNIQLKGSGGGSLQLGLISRRCVGRTGTRYHSRGIDESGNVSNCVETEQIVLADGHVGSFVQIRGSIPLFWRQTINLRYSPPMDLHEDAQSSATSMRLHLRNMLEKYGPRLSIVNLVKRTGWEGRLAREFAGQIDQWGHPQIGYHHFDFHAETRAGKWISGTKRLLDNLIEDLDDQGYFLAPQTSPNQPPLKRQSGICRVNCIDCLDRTNVAQGIFARHALEAQLAEILDRDTYADLMRARSSSSSNSNSNSNSTSLSPFDALFRNLWADNGDAISTHYAGTGALKSDFTRTGRRGLPGQLRDLVNSISRYVIGNFYDGARQDGMDLFYGHYTVNGGADGTLSFLDDGYHRHLRWVPFIFKIALVALTTGLLLRLTGSGMGVPLLGGFLRSTVILVLLLSLLLGSGGWIFWNAIHYVQYPRLIPPPVAVRARAARMSSSRTLQQRVMDIYRLQGPSRKVHAI